MEPYIEGAASSGRRRTRRSARKYARSIAPRAQRRRFAKSKSKAKRAARPRRRGRGGAVENIIRTGVTLRTTGAALSLLPK